MHKEEFNKTETIENLSSFIKSGIIERQELARRLHSTKSELTLITFLLPQMAQKDVDKKFANEISEIKTVLDRFFDELRPVNEAIYPKTVNYMGFLKGIDQQLVLLKEKFAVNVEFASTIEHKIDLDEIEEISIFYLCKEILEYLCFSGFGMLDLNFGLENNTLEIDITGSEKNEQIDTDFDLKQKLEKIKALFFLTNAISLSETDWHHTFSLNIELHIL